MNLVDVNFDIGHCSGSKITKMEHIKDKIRYTMFLIWTHSIFN